MLVWMVLMPCFCFASSACFASFKNLILPGFATDSCHFPSRRLLYTSICLSVFFEIDVWVYRSLCWICSVSDSLAQYDSNRFWHKSVDYFVCCIHATMVDIKHNFISWCYLVKCFIFPATMLFDVWYPHTSCSNKPY